MPIRTPAGAPGDHDRAGDDARWFADAYPALRRLAAVVAPSDLDPDDLLQDALVRVLRRGSLQDLDAPMAYLRRTMVNLAANHRRSKGRERRATGRLTVVSATTNRYPSDLADLEGLAPPDRAVLYLADVERVAGDELAAALGCGASTARSRLARARRRFRALAVDAASPGSTPPMTATVDHRTEKDPRHG